MLINICFEGDIMRIEILKQFLPVLQSGEINRAVQMQKYDMEISYCTKSRKNEEENR